jgi:hypothetical protein
MKIKTFALPVAAIVLFTACATVPSGPSVMVLPGQGKAFDLFQADDYACRTFAGQQANGTPADFATRDTIAGGVIGTLLGAAVGAAIGAAAGNPGAGAAVGAGVGVLGGSAAGASGSSSTAVSLQSRYDAAYLQCMYAKGHQIPVRRGYQPAYSSSQSVVPPPPPPPPPAAVPPGVPPPPAGTPPPPPPR